MNKEDFVSLECAKILGEKNFPVIDCIAYYDSNEEFNYSCVSGEQYEFVCVDNIRIDGFIPLEYYPAPTLYEAQKWLRENYHIHIEVLVCDKTVWKTTVTPFTEKGIQKPTYDENEYCTYESALNAGIMKALSLIITPVGRINSVHTKLYQNNKC